MKPNSTASSPAATAFTLIEVLVSLTICTAIAIFCVVCYQRTWKLIHRAEARMAMNANALSLYDSLHRYLSSMEQHCAFVAESTASSSGAAVPTGSVTLIFMHGKENNEDWRWMDQSMYNNEDLLWEKWTWHQNDGTLYAATSSSRRACYLGQSFKPNGSTDLIGTTFTYLPQPRRSLDANTPESTLNDNMLFPQDPANPTASLAGTGDCGDNQDLDNHLVAMLQHVSDFRMQLVFFDGSSASIDDTQTTTMVRNGVWMDGRLSPTLNQAQLLQNSDLVRRPRILRIRYTITDDLYGLAQTYSFSFALPGMSPAS